MAEVFRAGQGPHATGDLLADFDLTERIDILARNRHAIADYLAELQKRAE
ncbi:hypothetical protein [Streptomyces olivochromogenes]|nr:hypothetical protein [Streptomyces olivochromogenes]